MTGFELLERRIKFAAIESFIIGALILLFALCLLAGAVALGIGGDASKSGFLAVFGLVMLAVAWMSLSGGRANWPPRSSKVYRALEGDAKSVAWAYIAENRKTSGVDIRFVDNSLITVKAGSAECRTLLAFIGERAPHALIGFNDEQRKLYEEMVKANRG